jgi:ElaB/YqjD/DUF883 family membrane-anchored ribosome-binding protein
MAKKNDVPAQKDEFVESLKTSLDEAEKLLHDAAGATGDKATELRERAMSSLRRTRETLYDTQDVLLEKGRRAARVTDDYVHDNPWQAISMAGVAGLLVGMLISRR